MSQRVRIAAVLICGGLILLSVHACTSTRISNLEPFSASQPIPNGDFESYAYHWWHPPDQYGGVLDPTESHEGLHAWRMDLASYPYAVYATTPADVPRADSLTLLVWMRTDDVQPSQAVSLRVQARINGTPSRFLAPKGIPDLLTTGSTQPWTAFHFTFAQADLPEGTDGLTVYLRAAPGATGTVWFDGLRLTSATLPSNLPSSTRAPRALAQRPTSPPAEAPPYFRSDAEVRIIPSSATTISYADEPAAFVLVPNARTAIPNAVLHWRVLDYWGTPVLEDRGPAQRTTLALPDTLTGYFEVHATVRSGSAEGASSRLSLVRFPFRTPPTTAPTYPFGSWVQQNDLLPTLGARWTRLGTGWRYLEPEQGVWNTSMLQQEEAQVRHWHAQSIRMIYLFNKVPAWAGPDAKRYAPEHEDAFRAYVRSRVERYKAMVDIWETMNEPYIPELYNGSLDEIIRWHRVVYEEVKRADPTSTVIGLGLSPREPHLFQQMEDLLKKGIGTYLDGVALHTYGGLEAGGFAHDIRTTRRLLAAYGLADAPLFITEHGLSVPETLPHERLQAQHLVRSLLEAQAEDVQALIWHMMSWPQGPTDRERQFAIVRADASSPHRMPRPAFAAAAIMAHLLGNATFEKNISDLPSSLVAHRYQAKGRTITVLWDWGLPERTVRVTTPAETLEVWDIMGNRHYHTMTDNELQLTVGPDPLFVVGTIRAIRAP